MKRIAHKALSDKNEAKGGHTRKMDEKKKKGTTGQKGTDISDENKQKGNAHSEKGVKKDDPFI